MASLDDQRPDRELEQRPQRRKRQIAQTAGARGGRAGPKPSDDEMPSRSPQRAIELLREPPQRMMGFAQIQGLAVAQ